MKRATILAALLASLPVTVLSNTQAQRAEVGPQGGPESLDKPRTDRLTLDMFLDMETAADPQLSPDGTTIIYTRGWIDKMNDRQIGRASCRERV